MKHILPIAVTACMGLSACVPQAIPTSATPAQLGADSTLYDEEAFSITLPKGWVVIREAGETLGFAAANGDGATADASLFVMTLATLEDGTTPQSLLHALNGGIVAQTYERQGGSLLGQRSTLPSDDTMPVPLSYLFAGISGETGHVLMVLTTEQGRLSEADVLAIADGFRWQDTSHRSGPDVVPGDHQEAIPSQAQARLEQAIKREQVLKARLDASQQAIQQLDASYQQLMAELSSVNEQLISQLSSARERQLLEAERDQILSRRQTNRALARSAQNKLTLLRMDLANAERERQRAQAAIG